MKNFDKHKLAQKLSKYTNQPESDTNTHVAIDRVFLKEIQDFIIENASPSPSSSTSPLTDGRYDCGNSEIFVALRIDSSVSGIISADIFRVGNTGRTYDCSIRTNPGHVVLATENVWGIVGTDSSGRTTTGQLSLQIPDGDGTSIIATLRIETALGTLPVRHDISVTGRFISTAMRSIGFEIETEQKVDSLPAFTMDSEQVTVQSAFRKAGLEIVNTGTASTIPNPTGKKWGTAQLHTLMTDFAQARLDRRSWQLQLLLLDQSKRDGLFGVMFDSTATLPRQGCAVFKGEVDQKTSGTHRDRKLIQTTLHELGHALNLAHRFEREVGHRDSFSIMNYDWRFRGGRQADEFWAGFEFTFDSDELAFLRHAPLPLVIPGGAAFHSVDYWSDGNSNYSPYVPEVGTTLLSLSLSPPATGAVFTFGQPIFLQVQLTNTSNQPLELQPAWLDAKSGFIEFSILRQGQDSASHFHPIMERCFDLSEQTADVINSGDALTNNVNLTFGSAGFPFVEPGIYDITAILALPIQQDQEHQEIVVRSSPLRIQIAPPMSREENEDALVLFREDVGAFFALGGSPALDQANDLLQALCKRRQGKNKNITDPIVASIIRCQGINAGRPYTRYKDGKYIQNDGHRDEAAELLGKLSPQALQFFDQHTADATKKLCQKHKKAATQQGKD